jgi:hypothetical protein
VTFKAEIDLDGQAPKKKSRARWMWIALLVGLCLCCLVVFLALQAGRNNNRPPSAPGEDAQATVIAAVPPEVGPTVQVAMQTAMPQPPTPPPPPETIPAEIIDLVPIDLAVAKENVGKNPDDPKVHLIYGVALVQNQNTLDGYLEIKRTAEMAIQKPPFLIGAGRALEKADLPLGAAIMYLKLLERPRESGMPVDVIRVNINRTIYYGFAEPVAPEVLDYGSLAAVDEPLSLIAQARYAIVNRQDSSVAQKLIDNLRSIKRNMSEADLLQAELWITTKQDLQGARKLLGNLLQNQNLANWMVERAKELQQMAR